MRSQTDRPRACRWFRWTAPKARSSSCRARPTRFRSPTQWCSAQTVDCSLSRSRLLASSCSVSAAPRPRSARSGARRFRLGSRPRVPSQAIAFSADDRWSAVASSAIENSLSMFSVDQATGVLRAVPGSPLPDERPSTRFRTGAGSVASVRARSARNGQHGFHCICLHSGRPAAPAPYPGSPFATSAGAYLPAFSPDGALLAVTGGLGHRRVLDYRRPAVGSDSHTSERCALPSRHDTRSAHVYCACEEWRRADSLATTTNTVGLPSNRFAVSRVRVRQRADHVHGVCPVEEASTCSKQRGIDLAVPAVPPQPAPRRFVFARSHAVAQGQTVVHLLCGRTAAAANSSATTVFASRSGCG